MKRHILTALMGLAMTASCQYAVQLGSLNGTVQESSGHPAVGVAVSVRSVGSMIPIERKTLSDLEGRFQFASLFPGVYTLEIFTLSPWNMVSKQLVVSAGENDPLAVHLSDILTMAFQPPRITTGSQNPTEDAKWVLRTSRVTRPVLRFQDNPHSPPETLAENASTNAFSPFQGVFDISSGTEASNGGINGNPFVSSFAFIHTLSPKSQLLLAGGIGAPGSNQTSVLSAINFNLNENQTATVSLGLRQFGLPMLNASDLSRVLASFSTESNSLSQIENYLVSLDLQDRFRLSDRIEVMGGATFDHLESARSRNIIRPRVGLSAELTPRLMLRAVAMNTTMDRSKTFNLPQGETITLPSMSRMTISSDAARPESVNHVELSVEQRIAQQTRLIVSLYQDQFRDRALFASNQEPINVGNSSDRGGSITVMAQPRAKMTVIMGYAYGGGLEETEMGDLDVMSHLIPSNSRFFQTRYYHIVSGGVDFNLPRMQTHIDTVYRKIFGSPLTIVDPFQTTFYASEGGLNILISQPLPNFTTLPGQLEAQADIRNLFGQGDSRTTGSLPFSLLSQQPRVIRGGLSFKF